MSEYMERLSVVAVENEEDGMTRTPSLNDTYVVYTCDVCGALVRDRAVHDVFHAFGLEPGAASAVLVDEAPKLQRLMTVDMDTGQVVSSTGEPSMKDVATVAAAMLPGLTADDVAQAYEEWVSSGELRFPVGTRFVGTGHPRWPGGLVLPNERMARKWLEENEAEFPGVGLIPIGSEPADG